MADERGLRGMGTGVVWFLKALALAAMAVASLFVTAVLVSVCLQIINWNVNSDIPTVFDLF